jgi:acyl-CoA synthetase (AMP-forming)/AMP-acid ligase II
VRAASLEAFSKRFHAHGFSRNSLYPCYGLAESTLFVTGVEAGRGMSFRKFSRSGIDLLSKDIAKRPVVACGKAAPGADVAIIEAGSGKLCAPGQIGEICVNGPHVSPGFWCGDEQKTVADPSRFVAVNGREYLRSGDLGIVENRDLYVVGRIKDMIIVRGQNIYAEDVEDTVLSLPDAFGLTAAAAFAIDRGCEEALIIVIELARASALDADAARLCAEVRKEVGQAHGVIPYEIVLCPAAAIPRSSSGKIQRGAAKRRYLEASLPRWRSLT